MGICTSTQIHDSDTKNTHPTNDVKIADVKINLTNTNIVQIKPHITDSNQIASNQIDSNLTNVQFENLLNELDILAQTQPDVIAILRDNYPTTSDFPNIISKEISRTNVRRLCRILNYPTSLAVLDNRQILIDCIYYSPMPMPVENSQFSINTITYEEYKEMNDAFHKASLTGFKHPPHLQ